MKFALFVALGLAALTTLFAVQNAQQTQVSFLGWYFEGPLVIILLMTFAAGAVTAYLAVLPGYIRKSRELSPCLASRLEPGPGDARIEKQ